jgi:hypothetical protein
LRTREKAESLMKGWNGRQVIDVEKWSGGDKGDKGDESA